MDDAVLPDVTGPLPRVSALSPLRQRIAGHSVISELLSVQQAAGQRSGLAKLVGISPLLENARPWYWGALGEIAVGRLLAKLPQGWHVLHAVPVGKGSSDIDHVVIGPGGVFTINTQEPLRPEGLGGRSHLHGRRPQAAAHPQRRARG